MNSDGRTNQAPPRQMSKQSSVESDSLWYSVRARLELTREALVRGLQPSEEERRRVLKKRARTIAREPSQREGERAHIDVVEFVIAHECYGIESIYLREVYPLREFTPLPCTPSFVMGIMNIHGQIVSIVDLKAIFELTGDAPCHRNRVLILQHGGMEMGLLTDAILGLRSIPLSHIQTSLSTLTDIRAEFFRGVTDDGVVILDGSKILGDERIIVDEEA